MRKRYFSDINVYDRLMEMTGGRGPDRCIDAVGCEALSGGMADGILDAVKTATFMATDRVHVLRQAIWSCRKGGTISVPGVYVGAGDKIPVGALMNKGLTLKNGQSLRSICRCCRKDRERRYRPVIYHKQEIR